MTLYRSVAEDLAGDIRQGVYTPGQKIPSVRRLSQKLAVSISTINQAYALLEDQGLIQSRPQSGYFVRNQIGEPLLPPPVSKGSKPQPVTRDAAINLVYEAAASDVNVNFGAAIPDVSFLPFRTLQDHIRKTARYQTQEYLNYIFSPGYEGLRVQIARRMRDVGIRCSPDDVVITQGCTEGIGLSLGCTTQPGDIIAVESPCYYGFLKIAKRCGLKIIEIPTDPQSGISTEALKLALNQWPIKAVLLTSRYSNPTGAVIPSEKQQQLMELLRHYDVAVIEDDIYGDVGQQPNAIGKAGAKGVNTVLKTFDLADQVLYCSSFSKTVSPGMRIGWCIPGKRYLEAFTDQQTFSTLSVNSLSQIAMASYLEHGHYDKQLRSIRQKLQDNIVRFSHAIRTHFPEGTKLSVPEGGYSLWVCLPEGADAMEIQKRAHQASIAIVPGELFSNTSQFSNYIRINCAIPWEDKVREAIRVLGMLIKDCINE